MAKIFHSLVIHSRGIGTSKYPNEIQKVKYPWVCLPTPESSETLRFIKESPGERRHVFPICHQFLTKSISTSKENSF